MIFEFDQYVNGKPRPNLAIWQAEPFTLQWRMFSHHWPFSEPPALIDYLEHENISPSGPRGYLVAVSFFDFSINWFELIPQARIQQMSAGDLYLVFFYSEGDNPWTIRQHLERQCRENAVPVNMLRLISANSAADHMPGSAWFADDELLFRRRNRHVPAIQYHDRCRSRLFTALVRTHKWWRATVMTDFWRRGWHELGYFSYNPTIVVGDHEQDNPIEVDRWLGLRSSTHTFLTQRFFADGLNADEHNDHHLGVPEHFEDSYLNVVLETHMDVDQSDGVFLTEKTFKPIKNAQPFVIFGAQHSLARLRDLGYRTFDSVIDNTYDSIKNTTERYECLMSLLSDMFAGGAEHMHKIYTDCRDDLVHNQQHFLADKKDRLNTLLEKIK